MKKENIKEAEEGMERKRGKSEHTELQDVNHKKAIMIVKQHTRKSVIDPGTTIRMWLLITMKACQNSMLLQLKVLSLNLLNKPQSRENRGSVLDNQLIFTHAVSSRNELQAKDCPNPGLPAYHQHTAVGGLSDQRPGGEPYSKGQRL